MGSSYLVVGTLYGVTILPTHSILDCYRSFDRPHSLHYVPTHHTASPTTLLTFTRHHATTSAHLTVQVEEFGWARGRAPPLERLYIMARTAHEWLLADPRNMLAVQCQVCWP